MDFDISLPQVSWTRASNWADCSTYRLSMIWRKNYEAGGIEAVGLEEGYVDVGSQGEVGRVRGGNGS